MPLTRNQILSGASAWNSSFVQPTPSQLRAQLRALDLDNYIALGTYLASSVRHYHLKSLVAGGSAIELTDNPSSLLAGNLGIAENLNLLLLHHWIRIFIKQGGNESRAVIRIYVLPDDVARGLIVRDSAKLRSALRNIISTVDSSPETWSGVIDPASNDGSRTYITEADATDSLYYLFNNVTSPRPNPEYFKKDANYYAMQDILDDPSSLGLKTTPYDYQQRSAAAMLAREAEPQYHIDPRFEQRQSPTGELFYLDCVEGTIVKEAKSYEDVRGGILAENMGSGKTLISILLILSTEGHSVRLPNTGVEVSSFEVTNPGTGTRTLMETSAKAIRQHGVPYSVTLRRAGDVLFEYVDRIPAWYLPIHSDQKIHLSSITLLVIPPNLIAHWTDEIAKHVNPGQLSVYTSVNDDIDLLPLEELLKYDVIMLSKTRFEDEYKPRLSNKRVRDEEDIDGGGLICVCERKRRACARHGYTTPLAKIHFLRIIVDEALGFSKTAFDNKASAALEKLIAERKWLVSGTPSKGIRGVEIDMAMNQDHNKTQDEIEQETLEQRRARPTMETEEEQVKRFGHIVTNFFRTKPWSNRGHGSTADKASWSRYMIPDKYGKGKPGNLQAVVESLVVRHQIHEVSKEVPLPPLSNRVVYLDACPMDKIELNLFTIQLVVNAITSEREDQDYMFHPKQKTALARLFQNLRHASFHWTGLDSMELIKTLEIAERYAAKDTTRMTLTDEALLNEALAIGRRTLNNLQWLTLIARKEMGLFIQDFPIKLRKQWSIVGEGYLEPLLMGATSLQETQREIATRLYAQHPFDILQRPEGTEKWRAASMTNSVEKKLKGHTVKGISQSTYDIREMTPTKRKKSTKSMATDENSSSVPRIDSPPGLKSALKTASDGMAPLPEAYKELSRPHLIATSSSKLSYLLDKIMEVQQNEKSIIFYEEANTGYFLAQALEILEIRYEIYAVGIKEALRSEYLHKFETGESIRVLLMDLRLGSHGLHLASVTRVFFANPVWDETVEAQAIKRAHRTGQTKPVYIETLVLKGTLEDKMLHRRKHMTSQELQQTSRGPTSDPQMHAIIKNVKFLAISEEEWMNERLQCAPLKQPYQLYAREFMDHPSLSASDPQISATPSAAPVVSGSTTLSSESALRINNPSPVTYESVLDHSLVPDLPVEPPKKWSPRISLPPKDLVLANTASTSIAPVPWQPSSSSTGNLVFKTPLAASTNTLSFYGAEPLERATSATDTERSSGGAETGTGSSCQQPLKQPKAIRWAD